MKDEILTLNKKQLIQRLMDGEKLQYISSEEGYCIYDETFYNDSPFRFITEAQNQAMNALWSVTKWRIYKEPVKFWEPKDGELAWYIDVDNSITESRNWSKVPSWEKSPSAYRLIEVGNMFKTKEEADKYINFKKVEHRLRKAVWKLNGGPAPEFKYQIGNFTICTNGIFLDIDTWYNLQINPDWLWFKSIELAEELAETHKEDLLIYLHGV